MPRPIALLRSVLFAALTAAALSVGAAAALAGTPAEARAVCPVRTSTASGCAGYCSARGYDEYFWAAGSHCCFCN